jgi:hypothetical protein
MQVVAAVAEFERGLLVSGERPIMPPTRLGPAPSFGRTGADQIWKGVAPIHDVHRLVPVICLAARLCWRKTSKRSVVNRGSGFTKGTSRQDALGWPGT